MLAEPVVQEGKTLLVMVIYLDLYVPGLAVCHVNVLGHVSLRIPKIVRELVVADRDRLFPDGSAFLIHYYLDVAHEIDAVVEYVCAPLMEAQAIVVIVVDDKVIGP